MLGNELIPGDRRELNNYDNTEARFEVESNHSGRLSYVPVNQRLFQVHVLC